MDLKEVFKEFNASKFVFFGCLLPLSILISLKLSGKVDWSTWAIFSPLWVLNFMVITGAISGSVVWCTNAEFRLQRDGSYTDYKALLITVGMHLLMLMFEILLCDNIESNGTKNMWLLVFTPLFFASPVAIVAWIWGYKHDRSIELEIVLSVNLLLFIFLALKLDNIVNWTWTAVFIPLWIAMCLPSIVVLYYFIWTVIFFRSTFPESDRRSHLVLALTWLLIVIPLLAFQVLLAYRLDGFNNLSWEYIFIPLHISIFALIIGSFGSKGGNKWWFGIRTDFCHFVLSVCPLMRIYGNISYKLPQDCDRASPVVEGIHIQNSHIYGASKKNAVRNVFVSSKGEGIVPANIIDTPD